MWEQLGNIIAGLGLGPAAGMSAMGPPTAAGVGPKALLPGATGVAPELGGGIDMSLAAPILQGLMGGDKQPTMQAPSAPMTGMQPRGNIVPNAMPAQNPLSANLRARMGGAA